MPDEADRCSTPQPTTWIAGDTPDTVCPTRGVPAIAWLLQLWHWCQQGNLPHSGGVLDQPAWIMDALDMISSVVAEHLERTHGVNPQQ